LPFRKPTRPDPPVIPADLITKRYADENQVYYTCWAAADTGVRDDENCPITGSQAWNGTENIREQRLVDPVILSNLLVFVRANNNTVDGAQIVSRVSGSQGNMEVTIDQATGAFLDLVNTDSVGAGAPLPAQGTFNVRYFEGLGTVSLSPVSCKVTIKPL